jgi:hypothetical protein
MGDSNYYSFFTIDKLLQEIVNINEGFTQTYEGRINIQELSNINESLVGAYGLTINTGLDILGSSLCGRNIYIDVLNNCVITDRGYHPFVDVLEDLSFHGFNFISFEKLLQEQLSINEFFEILQGIGFKVISGLNLVDSLLKDVAVFVNSTSSYNLNDNFYHLNEMNDFIQEIPNINENLLGEYGFKVDIGLELAESLSKDIKVYLNTLDNIPIQDSNRFFKILDLNLRDLFSSISRTRLGFGVSLLEQINFHSNLVYALALAVSDFLLIEDNLKGNFNTLLKSISNFNVTETNQISKRFLDYLSDTVQIELDLKEYKEIQTKLNETLRNLIKVVITQNSNNLSKDSFILTDNLKLNYRYLQNLIDFISIISTNKTQSLIGLPAKSTDTFNSSDNVNRFVKVLSVLKENIINRDLNIGNVLLQKNVKDTVENKVGLIITTKVDLNNLDNLSLIENSNYIVDVILKCIDSITQSDFNSVTCKYNSFLNTSLSLSSYIYHVCDIFGSVIDFLNLNTRIIIGGDVYQCWVLNTNALLPSIYTNFNFNSFTTLNNKIYGFKEDGVYVLDDSITDAGKEISTGVAIKTDNMSLYNKKRIKVASFGISGRMPVLRVSTDDGEGYIYYIINGNAEIGKGLIGKAWTFEIANIDELTYIELVPLILSK